MLKHNQHYHITFSLWSSGCYNSDTAAEQKSKVNGLRVKSPTEANTDLHNGNITIPVFSFRDSAC